MKKLLLAIAVVCLVSCSKDDENIPLTQAQQEVENAKLVGTWWRVEPSYGRVYKYVFTVDFKVTSTAGIRYDESYTIPQKGLLLPHHSLHFQYKFEGDLLVITDWVSDAGFRQTIKYERE